MIWAKLGKFKAPIIEELHKGRNAIASPTSTLNLPVPMSHIVPSSQNRNMYHLQSKYKQSGAKWIQLAQALSPPIVCSVLSIRDGSHMIRDGSHMRTIFNRLAMMSSKMTSRKVASLSFVLSSPGVSSVFSSAINLSWGDNYEGIVTDTRSQESAHTLPPYTQWFKVDFIDMRWDFIWPPENQIRDL